MIKSMPLFAAVLVALTVTNSSQAIGPFNLLGGCGALSHCDECCEPGCGCETTCCAQEQSCGQPTCGSESCCENSGCESHCCDSGCDDLGCDAAFCSLLDSDPCNRYYASLFGGWNFLHDYSGDNPAASLDVIGSFNDGWAIGGAVGREIGDSLRGELEFAFRDNTGDQWTVNGAPGSWSGHANVYSGMANLYYDFAKLGFVKPYVGGGIGFAAVDATLETGMATIDIDDTAFAYQGIAGVATELSRNAELFTEYRYFGFEEVDVNNVTAGFAFEGESFDTENVFFGIRLYR